LFAKKIAAEKKKKKKSAQDEVPEYLIKPEDVQPSLDTSQWPLLLKVLCLSNVHFFPHVYFGVLIIVELCCAEL
jgi:hypothetical protein